MLRKWLPVLALVSILSVRIAYGDLYSDMVDAFRPIASIFAAIFGMEWASEIELTIMLRALYMITIFTIVYYVLDSMNILGGSSGTYGNKKAMSIVIALVIAFAGGLLAPNALVNVYGWVVIAVIALAPIGIGIRFAFWQLTMTGDPTKDAWIKLARGGILIFLATICWVVSGLVISGGGWLL